MAVPASMRSRLAIPAIAAPMTAVSGPELVIAASSSGVIGSFPAHNCGTGAELESWLRLIAESLPPAAAPFAPNLIMHRSNSRLPDDLEVLARNPVELVITSVGSPAAAVGPLHDVGTLVFADVASVQHVDRAIEAEVDGLVLLTAGAGGQTGWANPFAFVRAARARFDGTIVLAGGIADGRSMLAAEVLGADLCYLGTSLIPTSESRAPEAYKRAVLAASLDDVALSSEVGGIPANLLRSWLDARAPAQRSESAGFRQSQLLERRAAWSAGHSVSGVAEGGPAAGVITRLAREYAAARVEPLGTTGA